MPICKEEIEALFSVGEVLPFGAGDESALCIAAISDDHVRLQPASATAGEIRLEYGMLDELDGATIKRSLSPLHCFAFEYLERAEQARRDAEVDSMWLSAGVCQIQ